jgi:hypothetical protein
VPRGWVDLGRLAKGPVTYRRAAGRDEDMGGRLFVRLYGVVQAAWAFALCFVLGPMMITRGVTGTRLAYVAAFGMYLVSSLGILAGARWAWIYSLAFLAAYWVLRGWVALATFLINNYMFFTGHELYRDSPATIIVVWIYAVFGVLPATCLLILALLSARPILEILRGRPSIEPYRVADAQGNAPIR